jgi:uncharacterized protein (TIGR03435 family)
LSASLKFLIPFSLLMSLGSHLQWAPPARMIATPVVSSTVVQFTQPFPETVSYVLSTAGSRDWVPMTILGVWICGFAAVGLMRFRGWFRVKAAVRSSSPLEIPVPVDVRSSPGLLEPGVVGFLRPILLLPEGIAECLTPRQLEAVLAHELCHVRRRDNLTSAIHMIVEAAFWFHPLVWWIGARLVDERERACDEAVLSLGNEPEVYAEGILNVCKSYLESPLRCVSGVTGSDLKKRIQAILTGRVASELNFAKRVALAVAGIAALALPIIFGIMNAPAIRAQSADAKPQFEVASIKRNVSGDPGRYIRPSGGRLSIANMTLKNLIAIAYEVRPFQLSGGPSWTDSESYDIEAKPEGNATPKQMEGPMLQALIEDRFKLQVRHDTKELPIYVLTVARNGSKLQRSDEKACVPVDPSNPPLPSQGRNPSDTCGFLGLGRGSLNANQVSMADLTMALSQLLGRTVVDRTGLAGKFDAHMTFDPNDPTAASSDPTLPSIFTAAQEQLGLKLESAKGPVDILVIDRAERPTEN